MVRRRNVAARVAASELQSIADRMAAVRITTRGRRRRGVRNGPAPNIPAAQGSTAVVVASSRRRNRRRVGGAFGGMGAPVGNGGQITLTRSELFATVTVESGQDFKGLTNLVSPSTNIMTFLYRLAKCYTRIRWNNLSFEWKPAVGTSQAGIITYGLRLMDDRANAKEPTSRAEVSALYPVNDHPVWQRAVLPVNKELLMSRKWYATPATDNFSGDAVDLAPGSLVVGCQAPATTTSNLFVGEFWVSYSVTLDGNRSEN